MQLTHVGTYFNIDDGVHSMGIAKEEVKQIFRTSISVPSSRYSFRETRWPISKGTKYHRKSALGPKSGQTYNYG